jgi:hypothetical protein
MTLLILAGALYITLYWGLRIFFNEYYAKWITLTVVVGAFVATLCMVVGLGLIPIFGDYDYFKRIDLDANLTDGYEAFIDSRSPNGPSALGWYLLYPYVALAQFIVWYLQIFFLHFKFHFIFTHGLGVYIMYVFCRFAFDQNVNLMNPDRRFGIERDEDGNIIQ